MPCDQLGRFLRLGRSASRPNSANLARIFRRALCKEAGAGDRGSKRSRSRSSSSLGSDRPAFAFRDRQVRGTLRPDWCKAGANRLVSTKAERRQPAGLEA
jgi:hypothetical protein